MSDTRPSDTQDDYPKFPTLVAQFGRKFSEPADDEPTGNHKADAEGWLTAAEQRSDIPLGPVATSVAAIAQAHATLYLAEQQRLANLIAYASHRVEHNDATAARHAPALVKVLADVDFRIREGLGL